MGDSVLDRRQARITRFTVREGEVGCQLAHAHSPRNACDEFLKKRLPQARFLDLDEVAKARA